MGNRILVTGAAGYLGRQVVPRLRERHDVTAVDTEDREGVVPLDVAAEPDRLVELLADHAAVVHLAHRPAADPRAHDVDQGERIEELYAVERANVDLAHTVLRCSLAAGVHRVVLGSSNQAAKWYEQPYYAGLRQRVGADDYPKPVSFYGWAKVAYESLGFLYASGELGRALEVVALRIVAPRPVRLADFVGQPVARYLRDLAGYVSERDLAQLVERAVVTEDIRDQDGVPFLIAYATSANARRFWDVTGARRVLGYEPLDDSEVAFANEIRAVLDDGGPEVTESMVRAAQLAAVSEDRT